MIRDQESAVREAYDLVPYPSGSHYQSHPDHLAALAILNGIEPAPPERCRVLELGCADGGNLIPMAAEYPESRFTGIDLSPRQIENGRATIAAAGLTNIDLRALSILDAHDLGTFDIIICHGVFSWVTPEVQERIFEICRAGLAPNGVAYISYNTYPGWRVREAVRDMVLFHTRGVADPAEQAARAVELVRFLAETPAAGIGSAHSLVMRAAREQFEDYRDPTYLLHEYLELTNAPIYFHQFAARAAAHALQYVSDAEPSAMEVDTLAPAVAEKLQSFTTDRIELEQYVDFAVNRMFRRTLLCHAGLPLGRAVTPEKMRRLFASSMVKPIAGQPQVRGSGSEGFKTERGTPFSSNHPLAKAALVALSSAWPEALGFDALAADVARRLDAPPPDAAALTDLLASLHTSAVVALHAAPPRCTRTVSAFPRVRALARQQAAAGLLVTNQHRRVLRLDDPFARFIVMQLDGTRSHADLVRLLDAEVTAGRLDVSAGGEPIREPHRIPSVLQALVEHHLRKMAEYALLVE